MMEKLSEKDMRALKIGAIGVAAVVGITLALIWFEHWGTVKKALVRERAKLEAIRMSELKQAGMVSIVPAFEMPQDEEKQKFLFRDKFNEQLKRAGIKSEALQFLAAGKAQQGGYKLVRLQCRRGRCGFGQLLDLLARLNENPYLVGIEELKIKCDPKNRQEVDIELTVSTFVK